MTNTSNLPHWHDNHIEARTTGEKVADAIAKFGGSWTFIILFFVVIGLWIIINTLTHPFDPYPFILLNLGLSLLAAVQAPIILMSQNRQADRDRHQAEFDLATNLAAKEEIEAVQRELSRIEQDKLDAIIAILRRD